MRIGILTGGGDCPGLNAVIRAVTRRALDRGDEVVGVMHGWRGLIEGTTRPLAAADISGILPRGGTILRTSRTNPYKVEDGLERALAGLAELDALVVIGGEDTLGVAARLHAEHDAPVVGVPKTIDNDLSATDYTFGFDTALSIATEAIDRLHSTAESHDRVMVCEVMGRHAGWIALLSGMAGGADVVLIPEQPVTVERCCELIGRRHARGKDFSIVVVSEGWELRFDSGQGRMVAAADTDAFGHARLGGIGAELAAEIEQRTGFETRVTALGHVQRGGSPTAHDRVLATRFGLKAADLVFAGTFGMMAALRGNEIVAVPIADAVARLKTVPPALYAQAETLFG
ncbi:MAG: ATP-dependent phosphofructokinase / diphosphate-dependent phosphofructokinase [Gaiellales bacterium]|jgi:phosphofructokinase-like protein|nr:ATP-dependent phosphofructokinase / diphosphate-dependent phosphofructokinase [Gaiellales bacterium]